MQSTPKQAAEAVPVWLSDLQLPKLPSFSSVWYLAGCFPCSLVVVGPRLQTAVMQHAWLWTHHTAV